MRFITVWLYSIANLQVAWTADHFQLFFTTLHQNWRYFHEKFKSFLTLKPKISMVKGTQLTYRPLDGRPFTRKETGSWKDFSGKSAWSDWSTREDGTCCLVTTLPLWWAFTSAARIISLTSSLTTDLSYRLIHRITIKPWIISGKLQ